MTAHVIQPVDLVLVLLCAPAAAAAAVTVKYARIASPVREFIAARDRLVWLWRLVDCPFCLTAWFTVAAVVCVETRVALLAWVVVTAAVYGLAGFMVPTLRAAAVGHVKPIEHEAEPDPGPPSAPHGTDRPMWILDETGQYVPNDPPPMPA